MSRMRNIIFYITVITISLFVIFGCQSHAAKPAVEEEEETGEIQRSIIEDPEGIIMKVNGIPVTKAEFDEAVEKFVPDVNIKLYWAFYKYFLPEITTKDDFKNERKKMLDKTNEIMAKVKSGEMTFEDAIMQHSNYDNKDQAKGFMKDMGPSPFLALDRVLATTQEGEYSEPFFTPHGVNVVKVEKISKDYYGKPFSTDYHHFLITYKDYLKGDDTIYAWLDKKMKEAKIEILDDSLAHEVPELKYRDLTGEERDKAMNDEKNKPESETTWLDLPPETVVAKINGVNITKKELADVMEEIAYPARDIYNMVLNEQIIPPKAMMGHFKQYNDQITKELKDIKKKIESKKMTFQEAQSQFSSDPSKDQNEGLFKEVGKDQFMPEFEKVMFATPVDKISDPFFTAYGGHILRVENETLNDAGEREKMDVRHILIGYDKFVKVEETEENQMPNNGMRAAFQEAMDNLKVVVYDEYIYSILPNLGKPPEEPETEEVTEGEMPSEEMIEETIEVPVTEGEEKSGN